MIRYEGAILEKSSVVHKRRLYEGDYYMAQEHFVKLFICK